MMVAIVGQYISQKDSTCQAQNNGINKLYFYKRRAIHMPPAFGARKLFIQKGLFDRKVRQLRRCSKLPLGICRCLRHAIASLNGAETGPPASLITFRVGCIVTCEHTPLAVKIPPASNATAANPIRRFMISSSMPSCGMAKTLPLPGRASVILESFLRQARPRSARSARGLARQRSIFFYSGFFRRAAVRERKVFRTGGPSACPAFL